MTVLRPAVAEAMHFASEEVLLDHWHEHLADEYSCVPVGVEY